ncbi:MAG: TonB family protein [Thermoanaerobaculia bacterium]
MTKAAIRAALGVATALTLFTLAGCGGSAPAPSPSTAPARESATAAPSAENVIGSVKVSAATLNIRAQASADSAILGHIRRGARLSVLADSGEWLRIRMADGTVGWVSSQHVVREGATARPRRSGCPPDSDYSFVTTPRPEFSQSQAHGIVRVDASVDAKGQVISTRIVSNGTGDQSLGALAEREIRGARFSPPVRNCVGKPFIFSYKRSF